MLKEAPAIDPKDPTHLLRIFRKGKETRGKQFTEAVKNAMSQIGYDIDDVMGCHWDSRCISKIFSCPNFIFTRGHGLQDAHYTCPCGTIQGGGFHRVSLKFNVSINSHRSCPRNFLARPAVSRFNPRHMKKQKAYAAAGVDIDLGNKVKATLPQLLAATHRREVLGKVGGFGGLFALDVKNYREPILVSSVDGVGTKLKIAFQQDKHDTIGADLVNHCVNDIAVLGAEPLFFLDYLGTGKLEPHVFTDIIKGFARACSQNNCALIGGETAQMPGFYQKGEYDVSGTIVGVVEKSKMLNGQKTIRRGDVVIGIASSGLHTNGYSLGRKIFFEQLGYKPSSKVPGLKKSIGEELLAEHISYGPLVQKLIKKFNSERGALLRQNSRSNDSRSDVVRAFAHITGGGFVDNIPRVLPKSLDCVIKKGSWDMLPIFQIIEQKSGVPDDELYQVFNMGIGMVSIVAADKADAVLKFIKAQKHKAWIIGEVVKGKGEARVE
jgi:phosphoribosylformylglycinamidine cyclo-ligase